MASPNQLEVGLFEGGFASLVPYPCPAHPNKARGKADSSPYIFYITLVLGVPAYVTILSTRVRRCQLAVYRLRLCFFLGNPAWTSAVMPSVVKSWLWLLLLLLSPLR